MYASDTVEIPHRKRTWRDSYTRPQSIVLPLYGDLKHHMFRILLSYGNPI